MGKETVCIVGDLILMRHPSEYFIISDSNGNLFRHVPTVPVPEGHTEVFYNKYHQPIYDKDGRLEPKYWSLRRYGRRD